MRDRFYPAPRDVSMGEGVTERSSRIQRDVRRGHCLQGVAHLRGGSTHLSVLEVGTGDGYQAALLSMLARQVLRVERWSDLAAAARSDPRSTGAAGARRSHQRKPSARHARHRARNGGDQTPPGPGSDGTLSGWGDTRALIGRATRAELSPRREAAAAVPNREAAVGWSRFALARRRRRRRQARPAPG